MYWLNTVGTRLKRLDPFVKAQETLPIVRKRAFSDARDDPSRKLCHDLLLNVAPLPGVHQSAQDKRGQLPVSILPMLIVSREVLERNQRSFAREPVDDKPHHKNKNYEGHREGHHQERVG